MTRSGPRAGRRSHGCAPQVRSALTGKARQPTATALIGSPAPLARLHAQASQLIGSNSALAARIRALRGYPIVVNAWESYCQPCQKEFGLFANASIQYGRQVAFLGADANDTPGDARVFLREHHVSYPSYPTSTAELGKLIPGGDRGIPNDDLHRSVRTDRRSPRRPVRIAEHAGRRSRPLRGRCPVIGGCDAPPRISCSGFVASTLP